MKYNKLVVVKSLSIALSLALPASTVMAHINGHQETFNDKPVSAAYAQTAPAYSPEQEGSLEQVNSLELVNSSEQANSLEQVNSSEQINSLEPINSPEQANSREHIKTELINKLSTIKHFSANFSQLVIDADGNALQEGAGSLVVSKPNLVHWKTTAPDESLIVSDGKTLWFYDPFVEQASAYTLTNAIANTPILLLTSQDESMWQNYSVSKVNTNTFIVHSLDSNSQVKTLELSFEKNKLTGFVILDASGQLSRFALTDTNFDTVPAEDLFQFTLPADTYLDDQR